MPGTFQTLTKLCCLSSAAPGGSLLTLLIPHSVPSRRGTRSRVQLDLSAGCTWHERTLQMSWCARKSGSQAQQHSSPKSLNSACPRFSHRRPTMQVPSFFLLLGKSCASQKTITVVITSCNAGRRSTEAIKVSPTLEFPH